MTIAGLMNWWNLLYVVPFGVAVVYLFLYTLTGVTFGDVDMDADGDAHFDADATAEAHLDADAHVDADADGHVDANGDGDHDADQDHESAGGRGFSVLALLGVGRVPLSLLLMIFLILWGIIGFGLNMALLSFISAGPVVDLISLPATFLVAAGGTGALARLMGRLLPSSETYSRSVESLVGRRAESISVIDETFGLAQVRQASGDLFQVPCRVARGKMPIAKSTAIVLYEYDPATKYFYVAVFDRLEQPKPLKISGPGPEPDTPQIEVSRDVKARESQ